MVMPPQGPGPGQPYFPPAAPPGPRPGKPGIIVAACILWIIYGSIGILGGLASMKAGGFAYGNLIFGIAFLATGIQTLMGKTPSVLGAGIACLVLGGLGLIVMVMLMGGGLHHMRMAGILFGIVLVNSGLLITAGILAIVGNARYKAWRATR